MWGVTRWREDEAGTAAAFVAVLATLFLTAVSLVVDVGRVFDEHGQLGLGADAAALAVAAECARVPEGCASAAPSLAQRYADDNARDGRTTVEDLSLTGGGDQGTVAVRTRSLAPGGGDVPLSRPRDSGDQAIVRASSAATWGPVRAATTSPLAVSLCDWHRAISTQGGYHTGPAASGGTGTVITPHEGDPGPPREDEDAPAPTTCSVDGATMPIGFVELRGGDGCAVASSWDGPRWLPSASGSSFDRLRECLTEGAVVPVPLFDAACAPGPGACAGGPNNVRLVGYGAFLVTGWRLPGDTSSDPPTCPADQRPPARCISGVMTRTVLTGAVVDPSGTGPTPRGVSAVQLAPSNP
jgi:hypothetical protein